MNPKSPRELTWAWYAIIVAGVLLEVGRRRAEKRIRDAQDTAEAAEALCEMRGTVGRESTERHEHHIGELNYELDGPWEAEPMHAWAEGAPIQEIDPESRRPTES